MNSCRRANGPLGAYLHPRLPAVLRHEIGGRDITGDYRNLPVAGDGFSAPDVSHGVLLRLAPEAGP